MCKILITHLGLRKIRNKKHIKKIRYTHKCKPGIVYLVYD